MAEDGSILKCQRRTGRIKVNIPCPPLLDAYVKNRGVDCSDHLISLYNASGKSVKAWKAGTGQRVQPRSEILNYLGLIDLATRPIGDFRQKKATARKDNSIERLDLSLSHLPRLVPDKIRCYHLCLERDARHESQFMCTYCEVHVCI